jgi:parallel beta-helix repeat protein
MRQTICGKSGLAGLLASLALTVVASGSAMAFDITSPTATVEITVPGTYVLKVTRTVPITIKTSNVTLDLNGYTMDGPNNLFCTSSLDGIIVTNGADYCTIKGAGTVKEWRNGIRVDDGCDHLKVIGVWIEKNCQNGIDVDDGKYEKHLYQQNTITANRHSGIDLDFDEAGATDGLQKGHTFISNRVWGNGYLGSTSGEERDGIEADLDGGGKQIGHVFKYNSLYLNRNEGLELAGSYHCVHFNRLFNNLQNGLLLEADYCELVCNTTENEGKVKVLVVLPDGNLHNGYQVTGDYNLFHENKGTFNGRDGFNVTGDYNALINNVASKNFDDGIALENGAQANLVKINVALGNGDHDLRDNNGTCVNQWVKNIFTTSTGPVDCIE